MFLDLRPLWEEEEKASCLSPIPSWIRRQSDKSGAVCECQRLPTTVYGPTAGSPSSGSGDPSVGCFLREPRATEGEARSHMAVLGRIGERSLRALGVRAEERRAVGLLALIFGLGEAGRGLGMNASDALFFIRFGVERLPWMYMGLGVLTFLAVVLYTAGFARYRWRFMRPLYWIVAVLLAAERFLIPFGSEAIYPALWLSVQVFSWVLVTAGWGLASRAFDTRQAKRLFSLLASSSILGAIIGNAATGPLANWLGTENLYLVYGLLLLLAFQVVRRLTEIGSAGAGDGEREGKPFGDLLVGVRVLKRSRLLQLVFASSVLFSVLYFSVWFPFNKTVSASFTSEASLAGFLGNFTSVVMFSTLLLSLASGRLYARFGVVNVILLVPLIYLAGFGLWLVEFSLLTAIAFRFLQLVWINGAGWTAWNALFNVYHAAQREQLRAFESGVPSQIGTTLSGMLLLLGERVLSNQQIFLLGGTAAAICGLLCWWMRPAYGQALLKAIRGGLVDVFTGSPGALGRLGADAQAKGAALASLHDPDPNVRRMAAELLGRMRPTEAKGPLIERLGDDSDAVRRVALESLSGLDDHSLVTAIRPLLEDPAAPVRRQAVRALSDFGTPLDGWIEGALRDRAPQVRGEAAALLSAEGDPESGHQVLRQMLTSDEMESIVAALQAANRHRLMLPLDVLKELVVAPAAQVRQLAVEALSAHGEEQIRGSLLAAMGDADERVRRAASAAAQRVRMDGDTLFPLLEDGSAEAQRAALAALSAEDELLRKKLISWSLDQLQRLDRLREAAATLALATGNNGQPELVLLRDLVQRKRAGRTKLILLALELLAPRGTIRLVERGLSSGDRELRTQALEALETLGEKRIVRAFLPLLESEPEGRRGASLDQVLAGLSEDRDPWMRAFALRLRARRLREQVRALEARVAEDRSAIVHELWGRMPSLGEVPMTETLDTLSTMDRILYLRKIPILDDLDPDDLHRIAEIAEERSIPEGGYLCREGELENELYLIVEGQVVITKRVDGRQKELRRLGSGHPVGELAILAQQPRSATVRAVEGDVRVLVIEGPAFGSILRDRPGVSTAMLANLARRLSAMT